MDDFVRFVHCNSIVCNKFQSSIGEFVIEVYVDWIGFLNGMQSTVSKRKWPFPHFVECDNEGMEVYFLFKCGNFTL